MRKGANFTGFGTHSKPLIMNSRCVFGNLSLNFSNTLAVNNPGVMHHNGKRLFRITFKLLWSGDYLYRTRMHQYPDFLGEIYFMEVKLRNGGF